MVATPRAIRELNVLLQAMPPGQIDMDQIAAAERRHGRRFFDDPPEVVRRWLLDQQRRIQRTTDPG